MKKDIKYIVILLLLGLAGFCSWRLYLKVYTQKDTVNIHLFPREVGGWTSEELTITDEEYAILETRNAFARKFTSPQGHDVYMFTVYSQNNRKVSHPPEVCYIGSGVSVAGKQNQILEDSVSGGSFSVNRLLLEQGKTKQIAYYWFKVGNSFTGNYWKQQFLIVVKTLLGQPSSNALIRLSIPLRSEDSRAAEKVLQDFSRQIIPLLYQYLP